MQIKLRDYQIEAIKKALSVKNVLWCMRTGSGKTISTLFLSRILLNKKEVEKVLIACTLSSIGPFTNELKKLGIEVELAGDINALIEFLKGKEKFILIKHSLIEELGKNKISVDLIEEFLKKDYKKIMLIIDEAHKMSNPDSWASTGIDHTRRFYERILIMTATPYSSKLDQIFGIVKLIYPKQWKNLKEFRNKYIRSEIISNWKTGKYLRTEDIEYINLKGLRSELEPFSFFYYPKVNLNYIEYKTVLTKENYEIYRNMCSSVYDSLKERAGKKKEEE